MILGPRRIPSIACPPPHTDKSISVLTSVGFQQLNADDYVGAIKRLRPDIAVGMADLVVAQKPGVKRRGKMVDRTHAYTVDAIDRLYRDSAGDRSRPAYFAPVLPLDNAEQTIYLSELEDEDTGSLVSGLALYESASLTVIPEGLDRLVRLVFSDPATPQNILRDVSLGADLLTIPFLGAASDAGMALDFTFPTSPSAQATPTSSSSSSQPSSSSSSPRPLALDMWAPTFTTDTAPISKNCQCYTCRHHHRAYLRHLLSAREMLAWTLLQIHNYRIMDGFFSDIRKSISRGTFEQDVQTFERTYRSVLPEQTGEGPRYAHATLIRAEVIPLILISP